MKALFFLAASAFAQAPVASLAIASLAGPVQPGQSVNLQVNLVGSAGLNISDVTFTLTAPTGFAFSPGTVAPASLQAGKFSVCWSAGLVNQISCIVAGVNIAASTVDTTPMVDGPLVTIPMQIQSGAPGTTTVLMSAADGAAPDSLTDSVEVPVSPSNLSVVVTASACDVNNDGKVDIADVVAVLVAIETGAPGSIKWALNITNLNRVIQAVQTGTCNAR